MNAKKGVSKSFKMFVMRIDARFYKVWSHDGIIYFSKPLRALQPLNTVNVDKLQRVCLLAV